MKKLINGVMFLCFLGLTTTSCHHFLDDDDTNPPAPPILPDIAADYIAANYGDFVIRSVEFEDICDDQIVLEVELEDGPGPDVDLYFSLDGDFLFTEYDIAVSELPEAVLTSIENEFSGYGIDNDDVERQELPDGTIQYEVKLIPASGSNIEVVFSDSGEILCQDTSGNDDNNGGGNNDDPSNTPPAITQFINENYPGYGQRNIELEDPCGYSSVYDVELEDGPGPDVELYFSLDGDFLFAGFEASANDLPDAIMAVIQSDYADYELDDDKIERFEMADGSIRYAVELESDSGSDLEIVFNSDGSIACIED